MKRSFDQSLRPKTILPSTNADDENTWSLETALSTARENMHTINADLGRPTELFLDASLKLSDTDTQRIVSEVGKNKAGDPETRSTVFALTHPVSVIGSKPIRVESLQIKGIVFDSKAPITTYGGAGWPREYYFGNRNGLIRRHEVSKENAVGYCFLQEAVNEFLMCRELRSRLVSGITEVPYPVGWGRFEKTDTKDTKFGFVILGHPALIPNREQVYLRAASELAETGSFDKTGSLLALRAQAMREVNQVGAAVPYRHFGNFSLTSTGKPYLHDLGNQTSLILENMYSDEQFLAETFAQLAYAVTPRKIVVPVPSTEGPYRATVMKHFDQYFQTMLSSYYDDETIGREIKLEDFEETFFTALQSQEPLVNQKTKLAINHCRIVRGWLENYRNTKNR